MNMPIDAELTAAVEQAARELQQPEASARRLLMWLKDISERELDGAEENQHLALLRSAIGIDGRKDEP
jgi:hypothetical protein